MAILTDEFWRKPRNKHIFFFTFLLIKFYIPTLSHRSFLPVEIRMKSMTVKEDMIHTRQILRQTYSYLVNLSISSAFLCESIDRFTLQIRQLQSRFSFFYFLCLQFLPGVFIIDTKIENIIFQATSDIPSLQFFCCINKANVV